MTDAYTELLQSGFVHETMLIANRRNLQRDIARTVQDIEIRLQQGIVNKAQLLTEADINRLRRGVFQGTQRLDSFNASIRDLVAEVTDAIRKQSIESARDISAFQAAFWQDRYRQLIADEPAFAPLVNVDSATMRNARRNVTQAAVVTGTIAAGFSLYRRNRTRRLRNAIVTAAQSQGMAGIVGLLRVSRGARRRGRLIGETTRGINIGTGDIHTHAVSTGARTFVDNNPRFDLTWTSVIDERTSSICLTRNGQFVNRDLGGLVPPGHINCRAVAIPTILSQRLSSAQRRRLRPDVRRAVDNGLPDFNSTQESFEALSEPRQRQILGPTRFRIFQQEGLQVRDFIGGDERFLTLDEISDREGIDISDFRGAL